MALSTAGTVNAQSTPLRTQLSHSSAYHAHPQQQIRDAGPQIRQSRLPIFKQVRSLLHRPPPLTTPSSPKWDDYTGELSESGKPSKVQPSTYVSPYATAWQTSQQRSTEGLKAKSKDQSPVSILRDEDLTPVREDHIAKDDFVERSPVSPVSRYSQSEDVWHDVDTELIPAPLSANVQRANQQTRSPSIRRKPVSMIFSDENQPPFISHKLCPSPSSDIDDQMAEEVQGEGGVNPKSHFSWTTYAPTVAPERRSIDTVAALQPRGLAYEPKRRFSWSTVATHAVPHESPPPSPPPMPSKYAAPPVQSILSRRRPIQRMEKMEWTQPAPRAKTKDLSLSATPKSVSTPSSATTSRGTPLRTSYSPSSTSPSGDFKALPLPPQLGPDNKLTHLEALLAHERDIQHQRTNVEKGIRDMVKIETASPLDVSFSTVRDAKKRLAEYRTRLDEVRLEEREIGVAIARARRREEKEFGGDGETLWVRRVTG